MENLLCHVPLPIQVAHIRGRQPQNPCLRVRQKERLHTPAPFRGATAVKFIQDNIIQLLSWKWANRKRQLGICHKLRVPQHLFQWHPSPLHDTFFGASWQQASLFGFIHRAYRQQALFQVFQLRTNNIAAWGQPQESCLWVVKHKPERNKGLPSPGRVDDSRPASLF